MDENESTNPLDIIKDEELIKDAQKDVSQLDVLVCGGCHQAYYFVEEFQKHKSVKECNNVSGIQCKIDDKPQVWGFTLWKNKEKQILTNKNERVPSSWDLYQKWTTLEQQFKDLWISAGRTLQCFNKISTAKAAALDETNEAPIAASVEEKDPLALDENNSSESAKTGLRTNHASAKEEYNVEKIRGKRFNPRKRVWEYEVKWENYEESTWEPLLHLENCKALVNAFEDEYRITKEKEKQAKTRAKSRVSAVGTTSSTPNTTPVKIVPKKTTAVSPPSREATTPRGRPQRSSKQKAMNQVKAWCGSMSDEESGGLKRRHNNSNDSDDSFDKKIKLEGESDDTDEDGQSTRTPSRKIAKIIHTFSNGVGKKLPDNVLIPDAKGVVRISQKQLPSLSSGVYIMSKSSGIIKLDPAASRIATSGGQAIVKVSPKIGQTQIKIIKKDDGSKRIIQTKTTTTTATTPKLTKITPKVVQPAVKTPQAKPVEKVTPKVKSSKVVTKEKEEPKLPCINSKIDDDSDDGIEELEFPTDMPLPEPDSPPGDFTLDPITGKVVGRDYPEIDPEPVINEITPSDTIDNIVKLAAADITEEDLKPDETEIIKYNIISSHAAAAAAAASNLTAQVSKSTASNTTIISSNSSLVKKNSPFSVVKSGASSVVNAAVANILQKTLQTSSPRPKVHSRVINQTVAKSRGSASTPSPLVRTVVGPKSALLRRKAPTIPPKAKYNIDARTPTLVSRNVPKSQHNSVPKRIGHTTVQRTTPTKAVAPIVRKSPQKIMQMAPAATPKPAISMPSLDEEPLAAAKVAAETVKDVAGPLEVETNLSTFTLAGVDDRPMFITADDGTVYQVAGQNEEGQTILLAQDGDGQQCLLLTNESVQEEVSQVDNPTEVFMGAEEPVEMGEEQPLVAQFIRTEPPSPGGTHKVVVMLPDGDMMVTQVSPEEYASLELDK